MINRKALGLILGVGLILRLTALLSYSRIPPLQRLVEGGDAVGYTQLAQNLLYAHSFGFAGDGPTAFRMPGYPMFLGVAYAIGESPLIAQVLQIAADLLTILVVNQIGKCISANGRTSLLAAAFVAMNPLVLISSISILPEVLAIFCVGLATLLLCKYPDRIRTWLLVSGVLSVGIYLKPTIAFVAAAFLFLFLIRWTRSHGLVRAGEAFFISSCVVVASLTPWIMRNTLVMHGFIPLTTSNGSNLYGGNNSQADGGYVSSEPYVLPNMIETDSDDLLTQRAIDWITSHPLDFVKLLPAKAGRFFWPLSFGTSGYVAAPALVSWGMLVVSASFYLLVVIGIWGLCLAKRFWELEVLTTTPMILLLVTLVTFGAARFALPAFPALALLASVGVQIIGGKYMQVPVYEC